MTDNEISKKQKSLLYWGLILFIVVISMAAYGGYILYPRFDLPAVSGAGLLILSAGAGIASFFAPCSFPLLVTLLSREAGAEEKSGKLHARTQRALTFASALSLGALTFLLLAGAILAFGGDQLFSSFTFTSPQAMTTRIVVGFTLILLGLVQAGVLSLSRFDAVGRLANPFL